jgi:putative two-component system response regulator
MALEIIKINGNLIDMVITDYDMPQMNGVEVTKAIRKYRPNLPILFITGWTEPEIKYAALEAGASAFLVSPVDYNELIETISQIRHETKLS